MRENSFYLFRDEAGKFAISKLGKSNEYFDYFEDVSVEYLHIHFTFFKLACTPAAIKSFFGNKTATERKKLSPRAAYKTYYRGNFTFRRYSTKNTKYVVKIFHR